MSSYIVALVAGPYASWRDRATSVDGREIPLGLFTRASLAQYADPEVMFETVKAGLAFYEQAFGVPYPFGKYDQIFVPEYNWGAMENVGAVTFNESYLFRARVSDARREQRAIVVLHELSHMWFGNSVTMKWWNDLWLNESFATWASTLATSQVTEFTGVWATFASDEKTHAAEQDQLPSTHPIVAVIDDLADVEVNFDAITYDKGASVLKQLVACVGLDAFQRGVGAYLAAHASGNATLRDLLDELERASGRELDPLVAAVARDGGREHAARGRRDGCRGHDHRRTRRAVGGHAHPTLRPHRVAIGVVHRSTASARSCARIASNSTSTARATDVPELVGLPRPDLLLVNDDDLTYAKVRLDERSFATAVAQLAELADPVARAVVLGSAWDAVRDAELAPPRSCASWSRASATRPSPRRAASRSPASRLAVGRYLADDHRERIAVGDRRRRVGTRRARRDRLRRAAAVREGVHADRRDAGARRRARQPPRRLDQAPRTRRRPRPALGARHRPCGARRGIRRGDRRRARARRHRQGTPARRDRARRAPRPGGEGCRVAPRRDRHDASRTTSPAPSPTGGGARSRPSCSRRRSTEYFDATAIGVGERGASRWRRSWSSRLFPAPLVDDGARRRWPEPGSTPTRRPRRCTGSSPSSSTSSSARSPRGRAMPACSRVAAQ